MFEFNKKQNRKSAKQITNWDSIIIPTDFKSYNPANPNSVRLYRLALILASLTIIIIGIGGILK